MSPTGQPLILAVAPNGAYKTKADHPHLPMTAHELAESAAACFDAGATMIHLHVRDAGGRHSLDADAYEAATAAIRRAVGDRVVVQMSSEAAGRFAPEQQMASVRAVRPEAVSLGLREIATEAVPERTLADFFQWLADTEIMTQVILYSVADVHRWQELCRRGMIPEWPYFVLFVLGRYAAEQTSSPSDLLAFLNADDGAYPWAMCAFGRLEHACVMAAAASGGHVRVGFENNLYLPDGSLAADNAALVTHAADAARVLGRPLADAGTVRRLFARGG
jgi:uncharacterized protein (DUF849 family)